MSTTTAAPADEPPRSRPPKSGRGTAVAAGGALLAGLTKAKGLLVGLKFGKLLLTMGSMLATIWFYARGNGWSFAIGFVLLILIHELGHAVAIRRAGLAAGYPVFIPFFGAMIALKGQPRDALVEAEIALAGPVAGAVASTACAALYFAGHDKLFLALAYSGFFLNLFNMTPLPPLDGGRVTALFSRRAWIVGAMMLGAMFLVTSTPQLLLIGLLSVGHIIGRRRQHEEGAPAPEGAADARRGMAWQYFGLCGFLTAGATCAHAILNSH